MIHQGHRQRTKDRFLTHGLDTFSDVNVLELLLFYAIPQQDTNPLAHRLINHFGTLAGVFDAPMNELCQIEGVGANTATLLKLVTAVGRRYFIDREKMVNILDNTDKAGQFLVPFFYGERDEVVYLLSLDGKCKVLDCRPLFRGEVNAAAVSARKVVETALAANATSVILAHNHTSGIALPSHADEKTTKMLYNALDAVGVLLADHIIVADDDFVSMADSGFFEKMQGEKHGI